MTEGLTAEGESSNIKQLKSFWTPVFTGVTTSYEFIKSIHAQFLQHIVLVKGGE